MFSILSKIRYRFLSADERDYFEVKQYVRNRGGSVEDDGKHLDVQFGYHGRKIHLKLRYASSDAKVFIQIFLRNEYESLVRTFKNYHDNATPIRVVDIGANIGLTAFYLGAFLAMGQYIAIEPAPENFAALKKNFVLNNLDTSCTEQVAIWSRHVILQQSSDFRDGLQWSTTFRENKNLHSGSGVVGISFSELAEKYRLNTVDILKMDIEGAEFEIFSPEADLSWLHAIKFLAIELHPEKGSISSIKDILKQYGFVLFDSGETTIGINRNLVW